MRTDRLHKSGGGLITLVRDNITFTTTDIPSTINTPNIELQMGKVYINTTKHITIETIYIPLRDSISTHYKTVDTDIQHYIQYITNIPHSVLTGDVNAHSTLWHSYTDDHKKEQLIADVISNTDHITLNTNQSTKHHTTTNIFTRYHIVCKTTQRNNIRSANTCHSTLKLLNEEMPSDIQKHKQNLWKEH